MTDKKLTPKQALQAECKRLKVPFEKDNNMKTLQLLIDGELASRKKTAKNLTLALTFRQGKKKIYFFDHKGADEFVKTTSLKEPEAVVLHGKASAWHYPKSVWPKEHIVSIFTNEGWELIN